MSPWKELSYFGKDIEKFIECLVENNEPPISLIDSKETIRISENICRELIRKKNDREKGTQVHY